MGLFSRNREAEQPKAAVVLDESSELFKLFVGQYATSTGISVTSDSAVASVAVLACLIVRAESLMLCPVDVYRKDGRSRLDASDHPVAPLIKDAPNPLMTAEEFWRWKQITEDLRGSAFARVEWRNGRPAAIWPMTGMSPQVLRTKVLGEPMLVYRYAGDEFNPPGDYPTREVMHFKGPLLSRSPYEARSLVEATAENIGLGLASEQFFARFLGNGQHFPMYLATDQALQDKDMIALRKQIDQDSGLLPAGRTRVFDRGLKVEQNPMSIRDADLSSHQRWILEQVCRTWRVPLPMVQDLTHGTYANSEQADLWLSKYTAGPIARNTEGVIRQTLFLPAERGTMYAKFNLNAMLRGDFAARTAGYSVLINCGVLSPNEARAFEDWNPYDGGDEYRLPLNTETAGVRTAATSDLVSRVNAAGVLVRSGFDPESSITALGLEPIEYLSVQPITVRDADLIDAEVAAAEQETQPAPSAALEPLLADARDRIMARHAQNLERGRDIGESIQFAAVVLAPIVETARLLGLTLDPEATTELFLGTVTPQAG